MRHLTVPFALLLLAACDPGPTTPGTCTTAANCASGERCVDGRCVLAVDGGPGMDAGEGGDAGPDAGRRELVGLAITPSDPVVRALDGATASVDLDLVATYDDDTTATLAVGFWSLSSGLLGSIDNTTGVFTANGQLAGTVTASVDALGMTVETTITVEVERVILGDGVPADVADRFLATPVDDAGRAAGLLYPSGGTVFPQNVSPPDVQWERGADGDVYRVSMRITGVAVTAYVLHSGAAFEYDWLVDRAAWRALAESAPETDATLVVDRWESATGEVIAGTPRQFRFADAVINGAIYYWDLGGGRITRIRGDGSGREDFMPNPPARPADGRRCVACHTVSRDGRRMAAELWDGGDQGAVFDLTADLSVDPAPTVVAPGVQSFLTASFSPDNRRLIANRGNLLFMMDGDSGATVTTTGAPLPIAGAAHPSWSPDGAVIAFAANTNGSWGVDFTSADLGLIDVTAPDELGPARTIFSGAGLAVARPSWSPDSQWIAIQHGQHSRAFEDPGGALPSIRRDATVRMVGRDGARVIDLAALNGGASNSYYPTFSPFDEGGYFWLAFFSTRDYGNAQAGTRGTGRRQLWVSAVSSAPLADADPSRPAYWLPQQDVDAQNMAAFWSEEPCHADGRTCATSGECCSGFCRDTGDGPICVPPDTVPCSEVGESCVTDADCCVGAGTCTGNRCSSLM